MRLGLVRESATDERRVALVPADIPTLTKLDLEITVEAGAGLAAGYPDREYQSRGASIGDRGTVLSQADIVVMVRSAGDNAAGGLEDARCMKEGALLIGHLNPYQPDESFRILAERKISALSMELMPRITRAQSMDALSSQANLSGYRSVLIAARELPKMFPMMMTAAGTIVPAKVFVVGVGVAGLQAIATARRLGAVVSAYDIRPAVKEQVESLGARFVEMELETKETETAGGYAREMNEEFYRKQREFMTKVVAESDVVITTAAVPGKKAPVLVTAEMVKCMRPGSVVVDLAAERGGNCEMTRPGETVVENGVSVVGAVNVPATIAYHASQLYSRNIAALLKEIVSNGSLALDQDDEIVAATLVLRQGRTPNPDLAKTLGIPQEPECGKEPK